ncbi:MAG: GHKL domain-containing protein, partial [Spirochaetales bacterium]|nr:GHKL domain-containing protein [Spirochaetales bacterium]
MNFFRNKSIRFALTFQLTAFLFVILTLFAALILQRFQNNLDADADVLLRSKIEGLEDSINVYWDVYRRTRAAEENFLQVARDWIATGSSNSLMSGLLVSIYRPDGRLVADNRRDLNDFKFPKELLRRIWKKKLVYENTTITNFIGFQVRFRSCFVYVESRQQNYIIHTALEIKKIEEPLAQLQLVVFLLLPLFLVVAAFLEWLLVRRSLGSLVRFMDEVRGMDVVRLRDPFHAEKFPETEIQDLAKTFNTLLARIEGAFVQQRRVFEDLSHQMKTPLAVMRGELEVALKKRRTLAEYREILASNLEEAERMSAIVENLLKLARFDAQEMRLEKTTFKVRDAVMELLPQMEKLASSREVGLEVFCSDDLLLNADRFKIQQSLLNLLDNAIKYARPRTVVTIRCYETETEVCLTVHDDGSVIPRDEIGQVFERFWRSKSTMKEKGYGLGLSIVKALVEMQNGQVSVKSSAKAGTEFTL